MCTRTLSYTVSIKNIKYICYIFNPYTKTKCCIWQHLYYKAWCHYDWMFRCVQWGHFTEHVTLVTLSLGGRMFGLLTCRLIWPRIPNPPFLPLQWMWRSPVPGSIPNCVLKSGMYLYLKYLCVHVHTDQRSKAGAFFNCPHLIFLTQSFTELESHWLPSQWAPGFSLSLTLPSADIQMSVIFVLINHIHLYGKVLKLYPVLLPLELYWLKLYKTCQFQSLV